MAKKKFDQKESHSVYRMKSEKDVHIIMRDGTTLVADIFRPDGKGKFPALLAMSPYGKAIQSMPLPPQPPGSPFYFPSIEAGDPEYLVSRGYAHVIADIRGVGESGGEYRGWMSKQEAEDGHDLVEWIARQSWCDGNIGMVGISYFGCIQLHVAAEQPPHLKAIMPFNAPADFYRECTYHGGMLQMFFHHLYGTSALGNSVSVLIKEKQVEELKRLVEAAKENPDITSDTEIYRILANPKRSPCFFDIIMQPTDGPFYWERSAYRKYNKIKIPCYLSSGWWAYGHMHLRGVIQNYLGIKAPVKLMINKPTVLDCPLPREYNEEVVRWYDYWLKGIGTGIMDEPPVKLFVMGANQWRFEHEWPLARTQWTKFYLRRWQKLSSRPEEIFGRPDYFVQQPLSETDEVKSVSYTTLPMSEDTEATGPIALQLYAEIDTDDTNWIIALKDLSPGGLEVELSRGWLKASHRAVDESKSKPFQPYHHHLKPEPVVLGKIYHYAIELSPISNLFKEGHRIKLVIASLDHAKAMVPSAAIGASHLPRHLSISRTVIHKIYHDEEHPSHLLVPIIPKQ